MAVDHKCAAELVVQCFDARTQAHLFHVNARDNSYALHKALQKFYEEIPDLTDTFIEGYQGVYGLIQLKAYPEAPKRADSPEDLLMGLRKWIMAERDGIGTADDSELQNAIDEIVMLINRTLFKVRFFK